MAKRGFWKSRLCAWRETWNQDLSSVQSRLHAYVDMFFVDHGFFRYLYTNRSKVSDQVERRNHPTPRGVAYAARRGIKTIINLRGNNELGSTLLSKRACERHGIKQVELKTYLRRPPDKKLILSAHKVFAEAEYPVLLHCKSGADRTGLMAALYLMLHEGRPVEEAKKQLHWRYGHVRQSYTGILDAFLEAYEEANRKSPVDFLTWVEEQYDPAAVQKAHKSNPWVNFFLPTP